MTAPASWTVLEALAGLCADLPEGLLTLSPRNEEGKTFSIPVFLPYTWFTCEVSEDGGSLSLTPIRSLGTCGFHRLKLRGKWYLDGVTCTYAEGYTIAELAFDPGKDTVRFTRIAENA